MVKHNCYPNQPMPRSLKVRQEYIPKVKAAVQRQGYPRQKDLAEDVGMSRDTVRKFLNGYAIDNLNFIDICHRLELVQRRSDPIPP